MELKRLDMRHIQAGIKFLEKEKNKLGKIYILI